jgi:sodium-independent sulfate anion transporter 11
MYISTVRHSNNPQIMAVFHLISPPRLFYRYYRMSFVDFVASMLGFWVTLFTSTEIGLATSVGFNIAVALLRLAFPSKILLSNIETGRERWNILGCGSTGALDVPPEAYYVRFTDDLLFPNAERLKSAIVESVKVRYEPSRSSTDLSSSPDRSWNVSDLKRIPRLRARQGIQPFRAEVATLRHVVLDFTMVTFMDVTGTLSLLELKMELRRYIGPGLRFRLVGVNAPMRERFRRSEWDLADEGDEGIPEGVDVLYGSLEDALLYRREGSDREEIVAEKALEM